MHAFRQTGCLDGKGQNQIAFNACSAAPMEEKYQQALLHHDDVELRRNQNLMSTGEGDATEL